MIVREQTEGEYSSLEHELVPGVIECLKISTRTKAERIAKFAFDYATKTGRKKVQYFQNDFWKIGKAEFHS